MSLVCVISHALVCHTLMSEVIHTQTKWAAVIWWMKKTFIFDMSKNVWIGTELIQTVLQAYSEVQKLLLKFHLKHKCIYTHLLKKKTYFEKVTFLTDSLYTTTDFFIYLFIWKHKVELILFSYIFIQMHCFFCDSGVVKSLWLIQCYAVDCHYVIFSKLVSLDIQCLLCK